MTDQPSPTIHVLGEGGGIFELSLPLHETIADRLARGHLRRVHPDGSPYDEQDRPDGAPSLPTSRPALNAPKAEWIGWAVANGERPDDAEASTKADLIERHGLQGQPAVEDTVPEPEAPAESTGEAAAPTE